MRRSDPRPESRADEQGFTLMELAVVVGVSAFVFAALASVMYSGIRVLAVQKARTQGNEVATQAIEDLQRFSYDLLGFCGEPTNAAADASLSTTVILGGGCSSAPTEDSCTNPAGSGLKSYYTCTRNNVTYNVNRYIAWSDSARTAKRLAVFVDWRDQVGVHTVSQQSSVRAPSVASIVGISAPTLSSPSVTPSTVAVADNELQSGMSLSVCSSGLTTSDKVFAEFSTVDDAGDPTKSSVFLTGVSTPSCFQWSGTVNAGDFRWGAGSQFVTFNAIRASDGKATSTITTPATCFVSGAPDCATSSLPGFVTGSISVPGSVALDPSGALKADVTVRVSTKNTTAGDSVSVAFQTLSGLVSVYLQPDPAVSCTISSCTWTGKLLKSAGYALPGGTRPFYFTIQQIIDPDPTSVDKGSTAATTSGNVVFG